MRKFSHVARVNVVKTRARSVIEKSLVEIKTIRHCEEPSDEAIQLWRRVCDAHDSSGGLFVSQLMDSSVSADADTAGLLRRLAPRNDGSFLHYQSSRNDGVGTRSDL